MFQRGRARDSLDRLLASRTPYDPRPAGDRLIGWFGPSFLTDAAGSGNYGTPGAVNNFRAATTPFGPGFWMSGSAGGAILNPAATFQLNTAHSFCCWFMAPTLSATSNPSLWWEQGTNPGAFILNTGTSAVTLRYTIAGANQVTGGSLNAGIWYHVGFTYDGTNVRLYLNGALLATSGVVNKATSFSTNTRIGAASGSSGPWFMVDCRAYGRALTAQEIKNIWLQGQQNFAEPDVRLSRPGPALGSPVTLALTTGSSWAVPLDWNSELNTVACIGGGGGGCGQGATNQTGGGGGAYTFARGLTLTPGGSAPIIIGTGGAGGASGGGLGVGGGDTNFNGQIIAKGGTGGTGAATSAGGAAASCVPRGNAISGGNGQGSTSGGGGGGGAGGPNGVGANGGNAAVAGGSGGGAGSGGSSGVNGTSSLGGAGGAAFDGTPGGTGGNPGGGAGSHGSGGGGSINSTGGTGGAGVEWTLTAGGSAGAGGGGGGISVNTTQGPGGAGGLYGGGGGGAGHSGAQSGGAGGQGAIIITYTPVILPKAGGGILVAGL